MPGRIFWTVVITFALTAILPVSGFFVARRILTRMITRDNANLLFDQFQVVLDQGGVIIHDPFTATTVAERAYRQRADGPPVDGWARPMRIAAVVQGDSCQLTVTSAGPDGAFGTADDVPMQRTFDLSKPRAK